ncbi:hemolysin transporter protein shlB [Striga asiatica]|uniref:Hemolysin transporter protein shlB n=1 Tax=Striga asiatica TaxID=4170 RepID=A0A5A7QS18_STRAF|nr:hemolysin transporter protein shlB [Striga asiatica]
MGENNGLGPIMIYANNHKKKVSIKIKIYFLLLPDIPLLSRRLHGKRFSDRLPGDDDRGNGSVDDLVEGVRLGGEWVGVEGDVLGGEAVGRGVAAGLVADVLTCRAAAVDPGGFWVRK